MADEVAAGRVTVEQVAQMGVGTRCWVYWPYLKEALICGASTQQKAVSPCFAFSVLPPAGIQMVRHALGIAAGVAPASGPCKEGSVEEDLHADKDSQGQQKHEKRENGR